MAAFFFAFFPLQMTGFSYRPFVLSSLKAAVRQASTNMADTVTMIKKDMD
jgi:hypothetical protein